MSIDEIKAKISETDDAARRKFYLIKLLSAYCVPVIGPQHDLRQLSAAELEEEVRLVEAEL